jgi:hypothetical protein
VVFDDNLLFKNDSRFDSNRESMINVLPPSGTDALQTVRDCGKIGCRSLFVVQSLFQRNPGQFGYGAVRGVVVFVGGQSRVSYFTHTK